MAKLDILPQGWESVAKPYMGSDREEFKNWGEEVLVQDDCPCTIAIIVVAEDEVQIIVDPEYVLRVLEALSWANQPGGLADTYARCFPHHHAKTPFPN